MKTTTEQLTAQDLAPFVGCEAICHIHLGSVLIRDLERGTITAVSLIRNGVQMHFPSDGSNPNDDENWSNPEWVKPILRPLLNMTVQERKEYSEMHTDGELSQFEFDRLITIWYIRQGFDVFGWIEKGLAIDKTKI